MNAYQSAHNAAVHLLADLCKDAEEFFNNQFINMLTKEDRAEFDNAAFVNQLATYLPTAEIFIVERPIFNHIGTRGMHHTYLAQPHQILSDVGLLVLPPGAFTVDDHPNKTDLYVLWYAFADSLYMFTIETPAPRTFRLIHYAYSEYGTAVTAITGDDPNSEELNLLINDLFHFMSQTITRISTARINKDAQRAMKKATGHRPKEYNIIHLRRSVRRDKDLAEVLETGRTLKNQHVVRSHWKRYHTREGVEWRKVRKHLRGPDGTEIHEPKRLFHVNR